jgi:phytoene synthase
MTPEDYCQDKASQSGSSFYYSFVVLPKKQRQAITALYAFCREVDDVVDNIAEPTVAQAKLDWWRDELDRLYQGHPLHPVTQALAHVLEHTDLPKEQLQEILDGMNMDLEQNRYVSLKELSLYCYRVASVVGLLAADIFGHHNHQTQKYARDLGMAFQLTNIIRDVREDAERNRIYLPQSMLAEFHVTESDILQLKQTPELSQLLAELASQAKHYYQKAFTHLPDEDRYAQRAGLMMAAIYQAVLTEVEQDGFQVMRHRISLPSSRKLWIAFKVLLQEKFRRLYYR